MLSCRIMFMVLPVLAVCVQSAFAIINPVGKFMPDDTRDGGTYVVGSNEIVLSRDDVRTCKKAVRGDASAQY